MSTTAPPRVGDETTLFAELHPKLARQVRRLVRTSEQNVQDACSFAFVQLLRCQPSRESVFPWLLTVAVREAVKLDQRGRREHRLPAREDGGELEPVDERANPELRLEKIAALEAIAAAGLTARQARMVSLHAAGHTYESISEMLGLSARTVERQLLRARRKLRFALGEQGGENAFLPGSCMVMQLVTRKGELVAILGATRFFLVPEIEDRDPHDRDRRAISTVCQRVSDEKRARRAGRHETPRTPRW